ncbi:hypothetical protein FNF31_05207 [Cafeteria roenbergensis]|uniref:AAA+ ATPase domain-containing protein n=1 Tax=Cafeteria roenbergensis TaxID=33653 RepID=A0A5A8D0D4_CAFRO|nr:hypothetical protein FNF31_05207 [Cafeteria roenbergensis]
MRFPVTSLVWAILMTPPEVLADEAGLPQPPHSVQGRAIANMLASRLPRLPTDFASATDLRRRLLPLLLEETRASVASSLRDALAAQPQGGGRKRGGGRGAAAAVGMPVRLPVASLTTLSTGVLRRGGGDSGLHAVELDVEACHGNAARDLMPNDAVLLVVTQASRGRPAARHCGTSYHACLGVVEAVGKPSQAASGQSRRSGAAPGPALGSASDASVPLAAKMARLLVRRPAGGVVGPDGNALYPRLLDAAVAAAVSQRGFRPTHLGVSGPQPVEGGGTPSSSTSSSSAAAAAAAAPGAASAAQRSASAPLVSPVEPSALLSALSVSVINLGSLTSSTREFSSLCAIHATPFGQLLATPPPAPPLPEPLPPALSALPPASAARSAAFAAAVGDRLDASQANAVLRCSTDRSAPGAPRLHLIHGPPGTGKTRTVIHLVAAFLAGSRIVGGRLDVAKLTSSAATGRLPQAAPSQPRPVKQKQSRADVLAAAREAIQRSKRRRDEAAEAAAALDPAAKRRQAAAAQLGAQTTAVLNAARAAAEAANSAQHEQEQQQRDRARAKPDAAGPRTLEISDADVKSALGRVVRPPAASRAVAAAAAAASAPHMLPTRGAAPPCPPHASVSRAADAAPAFSGRVLVCAPSNAAVDEVLARLTATKDGSGCIPTRTGGLDTPRVVRLGNEDSIRPDLRCFSLDAQAKALTGESAARAAAAPAATEGGSSAGAARGGRAVVRVATSGIASASLARPPAVVMSMRDARAAVLRRAHVVFATLSTAGGSDNTQGLGRAVGSAQGGRARGGSVASQLAAASAASLRWDAVVIDEACQATEPSVMVAIAAATTTREDGRAAGAPPTVVLVGDPCQLPATLLSKRSSSSGLGRSTFERVLAASADGGRTVADVISPHAPHLAPAAASWRPGGAGGYFLLSTQYRMHPDIRAFPGREFYGDKLRDGIRPEDPLAAAASLGPEQALQRVVPWQAFYACDVFAPLRFFDLRPMHPAPSRFENPSEARFVAVPQAVLVVGDAGWLAANDKVWRRLVDDAARRRAIWQAGDCVAFFKGAGLPADVPSWHGKSVWASIGSRMTGFL